MTLNEWLRNKKIIDFHSVPMSTLIKEQDQDAWLVDDEGWLVNVLECGTAVTYQDDSQF